ncbi:hypothetical protein SISSUDRAFT_1044415 [Sistotremastrum suecicum HHB10207 ss-3]|uniref:Metallo-beta-lactamase domain-containing protein n=1 Tax=Sistotremastrum suecicum HHB10207 ss-3 TaxID=1314776 RepID=A0A166F6U4_9AGAM|nr:hypothetical protein SISSUDRAFT_1044415 [Sistotremastrum suecicum HHB10207 ss-3]
MGCFELELQINELGGIQHIVISHPHYWTTHITWSHAFNNCPVHLSSADKEFLSRPDPHSVRSSNWIGSSPKEIVPGILAIPVGGHFPGSLVLLWKDHLFVADSVQVIPSGLYDIDRPAGTVSVAFMWSYPNMIPLPPSEISNITKSIEPYSFDILHGAFPGLDVFRGGKKKIFESARIVVGKMGYDAKAYISDLY